jgi:hypothetical protein
MQDILNENYADKQSCWKGEESLHHVETLQFAKAKTNLPYLSAKHAAVVRCSIARGQYEVASVISEAARLIFQGISSFCPTLEETTPGTLALGLAKGCFLAATDSRVSDFWIRRWVVSYPKDIGSSGRISNTVSFACACATIVSEIAAPIFRYTGSKNPETGLWFRNWVATPISIGLQAVEIGTKIFAIPTSGSPIPLSIAGVAYSVASLALSCETFITLEAYQLSIGGRTALRTAQKISSDLGVIRTIAPIAIFCASSLTKMFFNESLSFLAGRLTGITIATIPDWTISVTLITTVATYRIWHDARKIRASHLMQTAHSFLSLELHKEAQESLLEAKEWNFGDTNTVEKYTKCITFIKTIPSLTPDEASKTKVANAVKDIDSMLSIAKDIAYYSWIRTDFFYYKVISYLRVEGYTAATNVLQENESTPEICARTVLYLIGQAQTLTDDSKHAAAETLLKTMEEAFDATYRNVVAKYREYIACCRAKKTPDTSKIEEAAPDATYKKEVMQHGASQETKYDRALLQAVEAVIAAAAPIPALLPIKHFLFSICDELRYEALCNLFSEKPKDLEVQALFGKLSSQMREVFVFRLIALAWNLRLEEKYDQAHQELKNACEQLKVFSYHDYFIGELLPRYLGYLASKARYPTLTEASSAEEIQDRLFRIDRVNRFAKQRPSSPELSRLHLELQYEKGLLCIHTGKSKEAAFLWAQEDLHPQVSTVLAVQLINKAYQLQYQRGETEAQRQQGEVDALAYLKKINPSLKGFRYLDFFDKYQAYLRCTPNGVKKIAAIDGLVEAAKLIKGVDLSRFLMGLQCDKFSLCLDHEEYQAAKQILDQPEIDLERRSEWVEHFTYCLLDKVRKRQEAREAIEATSDIFDLIVGLIPSIDEFIEELSLNKYKQSNSAELKVMSMRISSMKQKRGKLYYIIGKIEEANGHIPEAGSAYLICLQLLIELGEVGETLNKINRILSKPQFSGSAHIGKSGHMVFKQSAKKQNVPMQTKAVQSVEHKETPTQRVADVLKAPLLVKRYVSHKNLHLTQTLTFEDRAAHRKALIQKASQRNKKTEKILNEFF